MVVERLISLRNAIQNPLWMIVIGGLISMISLSISFFTFPNSIGLFTTIFITIAILPFMLSLNVYHESMEERIPPKSTGRNFFSRHKDILKVYAAFFGGVILTLSIIYILLPESLVEKIFSDQINEINRIRGQFFFSSTFLRIVVNNIGVLLLSFIFSFVYGAGAIFILAWNASILATAIGLATKTIGGYTAFPKALLIFFPHGSLEILAYFIGAIAGGLVSAALTKRRPKNFGLIVYDSFQLLLVSVVLLIFAGIVETIQIVF